MADSYADLTAAEMAAGVKTKRMSARELTEHALRLAENVGRDLNALISVCREGALRQAAAIDDKIRQGQDTGILSGVPVVIKDNIVYSGYTTTCASACLTEYFPPYDATCVERLLAAGAVIIGKANMDEFGMGSSGENSAFGPVKNPVAAGFVPGGSSSGSAACVAARIVPIAYGSDTGGSVRQPAAFCGVVGLKPTYGTVSRYGLVAFASSTDQIGPLARTAADCALGLQAIAGHDPRDATSSNRSHPDYAEEVTQPPRRLRFGIPREYFDAAVAPEVGDAVTAVLSRLEKSGHSLVEVSLPRTDAAVAAYYIIANAEASANLARFDGIRYGRTEGRRGGLAAMYRQTRTRGFGAEVKRRIMLGTYVLSAGYYDACYRKALAVRELIRRDFEVAFEQVDALLSPTTPTPAFALGEKLNDPLAMYLSDALTIPANLGGVTALSMPCGEAADGRPIGVQITGPAGGEATILKAAAMIERLMRE